MDTTTSLHSAFPTGQLSHKPFHFCIALWH